MSQGQPGAPKQEECEGNQLELGDGALLGKHETYLGALPNRDARTRWRADTSLCTHQAGTGGTGEFRWWSMNAPGLRGTPSKSPPDEG